MSRSYRRNLVLTDNSSSKAYKRIANGIVRAKLKSGRYDCLSPAGYKRIFSSYEIHDFAFRKDISDLKRDSNPQAWGEYKRIWLSK